MHNDDRKRGKQRLLLVSVCLLSGVVCGAANVGSATVGEIVLPHKKPGLIRGQGDQSNGADRSKTAATETSTSEADVALPTESPAAVRLSSDYHLVHRVVRKHLRQGRPTYALNLLETGKVASTLKHSEFDRIKAQIAQSYLIEGKIDRAAEVAESVVRRSGKMVPLSGWVAGQAAWRKGDFGRSADMFAMAARSKVSSDWLAAGAAFWAARASFKAGRYEDVRTWQEKAATYPRTFYGLVALKAMGRNYDFNWDLPDLGYTDKSELAKSGTVSNAINLARKGFMSGAITELSRSSWMRDESKRRQLLAYLREKKVPALELYVARKTKSHDGRFYDLALFPESPWTPESGYMVDKAIVHALIRQESRFNPHATSYLGAKGLMQLLPSTAEYVSGGRKLALTDPKTNIEIGQKYVGQLLRNPDVNGDLFNMAVAYNAGPGNLAKWKRQLKDMNDPLLFIESIPSGETRAFVERVMVNYWMYRMRMGQDAPSLDMVASIDQPPSSTQVAQSMAKRIGSEWFSFASNR